MGSPETPSERDFQRDANVREALRGFLRESGKLTRAHGLTRERYELLLMIRTARGGNRQAPLQELMERLQLAQSSVVELVDRAEALGLVHRLAGRVGRRQVVVALSEEGERRLSAAVAELNRHRRRLATLADL